jgi:hypothetical protein
MSLSFKYDLILNIPTPPTLPRFLRRLCKELAVPANCEPLGLRMKIHAVKWQTDLSTKNQYGHALGLNRESAPVCVMKGSGRQRKSVGQQIS